MHEERLMEELEVACGVARAAGDAILAVKTEARAAPAQKADDSPVTAADLAADAVIRGGLARFGDPIVTEETFKGEALSGRGRAWVVDPLDGTEDFVQGRADYCVQIGLLEDGAPALGVVYQPETRLLWRGVVGRRCERIDAQGRVQARSVAARGLPQRPRIAISMSHPSEIVDFIVEELASVPVPRGSVGLKIGMIVDGEADAYITASRRIKVWDTCAPAAVLLAAGGVVTALDGTPLSYLGPAAHGGGVCAWTPAARDHIRPRLEALLGRFA